MRVNSPADVLAVVPYLFGFHPGRSFVVMGAAGPREHIRLGFRYDLPDPPDASVAAEIADHAVATLTSHQVKTVIGVGYGPGQLVTPVADALAAAVRRRRLRLRELLRADDGHYWSYLCANPNCCPAQGVAFDFTTHPAAAALTAAGLAAYPDRAALAQSLAPLTGEPAKAMAVAIEQARTHADGLMGSPDHAGPDQAGSLRALQPVINEGRRAVREAVRLYRRGDRITRDSQFGWLIVSLAHLPVRDDAWARMVPEHRDSHLVLWTDVVRRAHGPWLPAPCSLLAFTAWQVGNGTLANVALDLALTADPGYSMALLLRDILEAGIHPSHARLPMTPAQVARGYQRAMEES